MNAGVDLEFQWDDGTTLMSKSGFVPWLKRRVETGAPAACVRFGDVEAQLVTADPGDHGAIETVGQKLKRETGNSFSSSEVLEVKALVSFAFHEADVLGIRFVRAFPDEYRMWMEKLFDLYAEQRTAGRTAAALAHNLLGHDLLDVLPALLKGRSISVVSCRDLKPILEGEWGVADVAMYPVPSQHETRDVDGPYEARMHDVPIWPRLHSRIREELTVRERGEVFLVGAGVFGKDLCILVREQGGIAIDTGSALDRIAGKLTRGPLRRILKFRAMGLSNAEIAAHLEEAYRIPIDEAKISKALRRHSEGQQ